MNKISCIVTEIGSSVKEKTGVWRIFKPIIEKCTGCGICRRFCPEGCIEIKGKAIIDYNYCKGCMICMKECPLKAIKVSE